MIREAVTADIPAIVNLCEEVLRIDPYPGMVISRVRIYEHVRECVHSRMHFSRVSDVNGEIAGMLGAVVVPNMFHERSQAMVLTWYAKAPGDGVRLMREFLQWCKNKMSVRQIIYTGEKNADPRIMKAMAELARRAGMETEMLPMCVITK